VSRSIFIAIDPGLTGAIAAIDDQAQLVLCADLPVITSVNECRALEAAGVRGADVCAVDARER